MKGNLGGENERNRGLVNSAVPSGDGSFLEKALPGRSAATLQVRRQILEFVSSPTATSILLRGPIGVGKSTIARLIALLKRVAPLSLEATKDFLSLAPWSGPNQIDVRYLKSWYVELALTGLVETLAETQLFGSVEGAYSDAQNKASLLAVMND